MCSSDLASRATVRQDAIRATLQSSADAAVEATTSSLATMSLQSGPSPFVPEDIVRDSTGDITSQVTSVSSTAVVPTAPTVAASTTSQHTASSVPTQARLLDNVPVPRQPATSVLRRSARATKGAFHQTRYIDEAYLSTVLFPFDSDRNASQLAYLAELFTCSDTGIVNITDPRVYAAKVVGSNTDMPTFQQAMNGPEAGEYIKAMQFRDSHSNQTAHLGISCASER